MEQKAVVPGGCVSSGQNPEFVGDQGEALCAWSHESQGPWKIGRVVSYAPVSWFWCHPQCFQPEKNSSGFPEWSGSLQCPLLLLPSLKSVVHFVPSLTLFDTRASQTLACMKESAY